MRTTSAIIGITLAALPVLALAANSAPVNHSIESPYTDIGKYQKAFLALHTYRSSTQAQTGGSTITTTTEYVEPDRYHTMSPGNEMISIGSDTWVHAGGKWSKLPKKIGGFTMPDVPGFSIGKAMDPAALILLRGNPVYLCKAKDLGMQDGYHAILCQMSSNGMSADITLWLRPDFLPAKLQMAGSTGTTITTYTDFNAPITINQP